MQVSMNKVKRKMERSKLSGKKDRIEKFISWKEKTLNFSNQFNFFHFQTYHKSIQIFFDRLNRQRTFR